MEVAKHSKNTGNLNIVSGFQNSSMDLEPTFDGREEFTSKS